MFYVYLFFLPLSLLSSPLPSTYEYAVPTTLTVTLHKDKRILFILFLLLPVTTRATTKTESLVKVSQDMTGDTLHACSVQGEGKNCKNEKWLQEWKVTLLSSLDTYPTISKPLEQDCKTKVQWIQSNFYTRFSKSSYTYMLDIYNIYSIQYVYYRIYIIHLWKIIQAEDLGAREAEASFDRNFRKNGKLLREEIRLFWTI